MGYAGLPGLFLGSSELSGLLWAILGCLGCLGCSGLSWAVLGYSGLSGLFWVIQRERERERAQCLNFLAQLLSRFLFFKTRFPFPMLRQVYFDVFFGVFF